MDSGLRRPLAGLRRHGRKHTTCSQAVNTLHPFFFLGRKLPRCTLLVYTVSTPFNDGGERKEGWEQLKVRPSVLQAIRRLSRVMAEGDPPADGKVVAALVRHVERLTEHQIRSIYAAWTSPRREGRSDSGDAGAPDSAAA